MVKSILKIRLNLKTIVLLMKVVKMIYHQAKVNESSESSLNDIGLTSKKNQL